jgi:hypothetical protein
VLRVGGFSEPILISGIRDGGIQFFRGENRPVLGQS